MLVIGGPYGCSEAGYASHQIVRAIFAEQIYRAFTILRNEPYHHE